MRVLAIAGHPRPGSYAAALAAAYAEGAAAAGAEVELIDLSALAFDPDVHPVSPRDQPLEPDLERVRRGIERADHLVFVYPAWWGVGPARLRGLLDRVLLPGFAFRERDDGRYEGLLAGRTAHLVATLDMPPWVYRLIYRAAGVQAMKRSALGFCGVETTRVLLLGPVKASTAAAPRRLAGARARARPVAARRPAHAGRARAARRRRLARRAAAAVLSDELDGLHARRARRRARRGRAPARPWDGAAYWVGYAFLFLLEAATVFGNEWFDRDTDRRNANHGPFNGGSRVLVGGAADGVGLAARHRGDAASARSPAPPGWPSATPAVAAVPVALAVLAVLALGYTVPPLKLSWRGLGEIDVALTHGVGVVLVGHLLQGGGWRDPLPWLAGVPIGLSVLPAIVLSGLPDADADRAAGKRTLAVRLGVRRAGALALALAPPAPLAVWLLDAHPAGRALYGGVLPFARRTAALLAALLWRRLRAGLGCERIDGPMVVALCWILWFAAWPLLRLW